MFKNCGITGISKIKFFNFFSAERVKAEQFVELYKRRPTLGSEAISNNWKRFKNDEKCFYFMLSALYVLKMLKVLSWLFGNGGKRLDKKAEVNFKIYEVAERKTNKYKTHIVQYLKK